MPNAQNSLADGVLATVPLTMRYLKGFDDSNHTRQAPNLPNHVAWCLCHLALTMHRCAEKLDGKDLAGADFLPGHPAGGSTPDKCHAESVAFASRPVADPTHYPRFARCVAIFENAAKRLASALRAASDADLAREVPWGPGNTPLSALAARMIYHNGCHTGQIIDLRRALNMGSALS